MNKDLRNRAVELRLNKNLSYGAIREKLGVSKSTLSYWLRDFPLTKDRVLELRRLGWKKGEASREKYRNTMREKRRLKDELILKKYKNRLSKTASNAYFVSGLMLYLGEGDKKNYSRIGLANTDPLIIKFFIKWLIEFLKIKKEDMRAELHLYENMDVPKEQRFWKDELGFKEYQFYKTQIRKLQKNSFTYKESYRHGTCSLFILGVEVKRELMMAMKAFVEIYLAKC